MRCKNCGWNNPDNLQLCEKCHSKLISHHSKRQSAIPPAPERPAIPQRPDFKNSQADSFSPMHSSAPAQSAASCPNCAYPVSKFSSTCPNCGGDISALRNKEDAYSQFSDANLKEDKDTPIFKSTVIRPNPALMSAGADSDSYLNSAGSLDLNPDTPPAGVIISRINDEYAIRATEGAEVYIRLTSEQFKLIPGDQLLINGTTYIFNPTK